MTFEVESLQSQPDHRFLAGTAEKHEAKFDYRSHPCQKGNSKAKPLITEPKYVSICHGGLMSGSSDEANFH